MRDPETKQNSSTAAAQEGEVGRVIVTGSKDIYGRSKKPLAPNRVNLFAGFGPEFGHLLLQFAGAAD